ncbi:MAG: acetyl-CoA carboxylase biotin carboxyl carrier protein [Verrucomicrobiae bacterium]|nr:acetyl-CoA carboxylase biotin carboxyl carrier protein [Verrucomicrobiae bacterium]
MEIKEIKHIIDLMTKNNLSEFDLEREGFKIRIKRGSHEAITPTVSVLPSSAPALAAHATPTPVAVAPVPTSSAPATNTKDIVSPMVGTFYRTPSPDSPPYVDVGQQVNEETVVCIIEAMKVMNEIKAEMRGVIVEVLTENNKPVEFGQPLFRIQPL